LSTSLPHAPGILDTSTVIELGRIGDAALLPAEPPITAVTLAALSVGPLVARDEAERAARQAHLQQAEADFDPLPFDAAAATAHA
jgi:tRNA(fMet)-specific endonuclease VapC